MPGIGRLLKALAPLSAIGSHLSRQVGGALLIALMAVELMLLWPAYMHERDNLLEAIEHETQAAVATALRPHLQAIGSGTFDAVSLAMTDVGHTSHMRGGALFDQQGELIFRFGEPMYYQADELMEMKTDVPGDRMEAFWESGTIGAPISMAVRLDTSGVPAQAATYLWQSLGVLVLMTFALCGAALLVVSHTIINPLLELRVSLVAAGKDPANASEFAPPRRRRGVLGDLTRIIQQLLQRVSQTFRDELASFAAMIEQTGDAVFAYDGDGFLVYANKTCLEFCGVATVRELKGLGGPQFHVSDDEACDTDLNSLLKEDSFSAEVDLVIPGRDPLRCLMSAARLRTDDGRVLRTFASLSDITIIREAQWAVEQKNVELEEANRIKGEFLAQMSHELRTPLNAIIGFSEILSARPSDGPDDEVQAFASDINSSGHHLLGLINDILDLSKLEAGKQELHESNVDLIELANAALSMLRETARQNGIGLESQVPEGGLEITCDAIRIKQVLLNLLSNAIKFTPEGGTVALKIGTMNGLVSVSVTDTGIGMNSKDIPKALQPFAQVDTGFDRRFDGTGLGLPICSGLVALHGGELKIESNPGEGTKVSFTLPASRIVSAAA